MTSVKATLGLVLVSALGSGLGAPARADITNSVVKVKSYLCDRPSRARAGSGTFISVSGTRFVITSDHVLFHGNRESNICHSVQSAQGSIPATLRAANFAMGLALLSVGAESDVAGTFPQTLDLDGMRSEFGGGERTPLVLAGYPFTAESLLVHHGELLSAVSQRALIPLIDTFFEMRGHTEFGMSGGAVFDGQGHYAGLISHQYLQVNLGAETVIGEFDERTVANAQMLGLAIPATKVRRWIESVLDQVPGSDLRENLAGQIDRRPSLTLAGIRFSALRCDRSAAPIGTDGVGPRSGRGVGGDGVGVGGDRGDIGGDGVGVGGDGDLATSGCMIELSLDATMPQNTWLLVPSPWLEDVRSELAARSKLRISGFVNGTAILPVPGLIGGLRYIQRGLQPLREITESQVRDLSDIERRIGDDLRRVSLHVTTLNTSRCWEEEAAFVGSDLTFVRRILAQRQYALVARGVMERLVRPAPGTSSAQGWVRLYACDLEAAAELKSALLRIATSLERLRI